MILLPHAELLALIDADLRSARERFTAANEQNVGSGQSGSSQLHPYAACQNCVREFGGRSA
jgi:hypothetical protein